MNIRTHGARRGQIDLLAHEVKTLRRAGALLFDIETHGGMRVGEMAREVHDKLNNLITEITYKEPNTVDA